MAVDLPDSGHSAQTTAEEVASGVSLQGKNALITGASAGIGVETARVLAARGAEVTITGRDPDKLEAALRKVRSEAPEARVDAAAFDLSEPDQVNRFVDDWLAGSADRKLDLLVNNAGVMACPLQFNSKGWEMQFACNHMGHFLLTLRLLPLLLKVPAPRVVNLSSAAHRMSPVDFDDIHFARRPYDKWLAYGQSKTANILFSVGLSERFGGDGLFANAVHPGMIGTDLGRHLQKEEITGMSERFKRMGKSVESGAATTVWAATSPLLEGRGGLYLEDCNFSRELAEDASMENPGGYRSYAVDSDAASRLWDLSTRALGMNA